MEDNGALSNPLVLLELTRAEEVKRRIERGGVCTLTPSPPTRRVGLVSNAVTEVLLAAVGPMRASDVHRAAEVLAGEPLKWSTVKATLAKHPSGSNARYRRTGYGCYEIAQRERLAMAR